MSERRVYDERRKTTAEGMVGLYLYAALVLWWSGASRSWCLTQIPFAVGWFAWAAWLRTRDV